MSPMLFLISLFFPFSNVSRICLSSVPKSIDGKRSSESVTSPAFRSAPIFLLILRTSGPLIPTCVKRSFPVRDSCFTPFCITVSFTDFKLMPAAFVIHLSLSVTGTSAGSGSTIVCPSSFSHVKPSPVDPVSG